ncbi:MAG: hypothetical protein K6B40_03590 [Firmicutes bacterium]|nr:hypothetical protein [Bacillota bacterium]
MRHKIIFLLILAALPLWACAPVLPPENPHLSPAAELYYQSLLNDRELDVYQRLAAGVSASASSISFPYLLDQQTLKQAIERLTADRPDLYWFNGGGNLSVRHPFLFPTSCYSPEYLYDTEQIAARAPALKQATADFLACAQGLDSEYEQALAIYRQVILRTQYQTGAPDNQNLCSVLLNGVSVCGGYAKTMQYLLQNLGIQAAYISGRLLDGGESHAWVLMRLDGEYYFADPTLGDPLTQEGVQLPAEACIDYAWFGLNSAEMAQTHEAKSDLPLPHCTAEKANYYRAEGLYLENYSRQALLPLLQSCLEKNAPLFTFRLADDAGFDRAQNDLLQDGGAFDLLKQAGISQQDLLYTVNESKRIITLLL